MKLELTAAWSEAALDGRVHRSLRGTAEPHIRAAGEMGDGEVAGLELSIDQILAVPAGFERVRLVRNICRALWRIEFVIQDRETDAQHAERMERESWVS